MYCNKIKILKNVLGCKRKQKSKINGKRREKLKGINKKCNL